MAASSLSHPRAAVLFRRSAASPEHTLDVFVKTHPKRSQTVTLVVDGEVTAEVDWAAESKEEARTEEEAKVEDSLSHTIRRLWMRTSCS